MAAIESLWDGTTFTVRVTTDDMTNPEQVAVLASYTLSGGATFDTGTLDESNLSNMGVTVTSSVFQMDRVPSFPFGWIASFAFPEQYATVNIDNATDDTTVTMHVYNMIKAGTTEGAAWQQITHGESVLWEGTTSDLPLFPVIAPTPTPILVFPLNGGVIENTDLGVHNITTTDLWGVTDVNGVAPTAAHVGEAFALDNSDGWQIDVTGTGAGTISRVDTARGWFIVQLDSTLIQDNPGD
jgi:hypothetical protein